MLHKEFNARLEKYKINSVKFTDATFLITSNNISLSVKSRGNEMGGRFTGGAEQAAWRVRQWRIDKNADDLLSYRQGTPALKGEAKRIRARRGYDDIGYYLCEQHCVWAMGASARTGCIVPPEFFIDHEAFGGTAGNGPEIQHAFGGYIGGAASTISMAHDTDWMVGRLFDIGPMKGLSQITPQSLVQARRLGASGLFRSGDPAVMAREDPTPRRNGWNVLGRIADFADQSEENRYHAPVDDYMNWCIHNDVIYMTNDVIATVRNALRLGYDKWWVRYRTNGYADYGGFIDLSWKHHYEWDGGRGHSKDRNDIRYWNAKMTPYFADMVNY